MTCSTQEGEEEATEGSITNTGGPEADKAPSSSVPPGRFETEAAVAQSTCKEKGRGLLIDRIVREALATARWEGHSTPHTHGAACVAAEVLPGARGGD